MDLTGVDAREVNEALVLLKPNSGQSNAEKYEKLSSSR